MIRRSYRRALLCLAALWTAVVLAQGADNTASSVSAVFTQMGVPVTASFTRFDAEVHFDPEKPSEARARFEVDVTSFDIGDPMYNKEVQKPEWFDAGRFPRATFVSSGIEIPAPGQLRVSGTLSLKGRSAEVKVPVTWRDEGARRVFEGEFPIRRLQFLVGDGEWKDTDMVADEVVVRFRVVTPAG